MRKGGSVDDSEKMKTQLAELQRSVDNIAGECHFIREEQERSAESHKKLHQEHNALVDRIDKQEQHFAVHLKDYQREQEKNEIVHAHMTGATVSLRNDLREFWGEFKEHDRIEEIDRKDQIKSLKSVIMWVVGTGITLLFGMLGVAISLWRLLG